MSGTGLDLNDLQNGSLNTLQDSNATGTTGDPRRTNAVASLRRTQADAYAPDTIGNRSEYVGIVVVSYTIDFPGFADKGGLLKQYQKPPPGLDGETYDNIEKTRNTAYKVFIPEIDPRPVPAINDLEDPITISLPEVYANIPNLQKVIPPGAAVTVQYQDPKNLGAPVITRIVAEQLTVGSTNLNDRGCRKWKGQLAKKWQNRNAKASIARPPGSYTRKKNKGSYQWSDPQRKRQKTATHTPTGKIVRNGELETSGLLSPVPGTDLSLITEALPDFVALKAAFENKFPGKKLTGFGYRTYEKQAELYECYKNKNCNNGNLAATPGRSNHGWGAAVDIDRAAAGYSPKGSLTTTPFRWLNKFAPDFNFMFTVSKAAGSSQNENWHMDWLGFNNIVTGVTVKKRRAFALTESDDKLTLDGPELVVSSESSDEREEEST
jgi:hypothetical protein